MAKTALGKDRSDVQLAQNNSGGSFKMWQEQNLCGFHWMMMMRDVRGPCSTSSETRVFREGGKGGGSLGLYPASPFSVFCCITEGHLQPVTQRDSNLD